MENRKLFGGALLVVSMGAAALGLSACSEDDEGSENSSTGGSSTGASSGTGGAGGDGTGGVDATGGNGLGGNGGEPSVEAGVFALTTRIDDGGDGISYVLLTDSLVADKTLVADDAALEIVGYALGTGIEGDGSLFVATDMGPTITRYDLSDDGKLVEGDSVSFAVRGINSFGEYGAQFQYASPTKAYWFDGATAQIVVWNPTTMEVTDDISIAELAHTGELLSFSGAPIRKGNKIYNFAAWREGLVNKSRAAVIVLDTENDSVKVVEDDSCGFVRDGVLAGDKLYMVTEGFGVAVDMLDDGADQNPSPCMLRFDTASETFDEFLVDPATLLEGAPAGMLVVGPDNTPFLRYLADEAAVEGMTSPFPLWGAAAWGWAKLTVGDTPTAAVVEDAALSSLRVVKFDVGGRTFAPVIGESTTALVELTADGPSDNAALEVPGVLFSAVKLK